MSTWDSPVVFSVVIPVYDEIEVLPDTYKRLKRVMETLEAPYEILFVDDASTDGSGRYIEMLRSIDPSVHSLHFSRNFGHQIAITAGMDHATGAAVIVMDADLQDPPELIPDMVQRWRAGYAVVYARRVRRQGETWFKRASAALFYRALRSMTDVDIPVDTGDFRLIDRKVCDVLTRTKERRRFVRGLVAWAGFSQTAVEYVRDPRVKGETKYTLRKMVRLSMDAILAFSEVPLKLPLYAGGLSIGIAVVLGVLSVSFLLGVKQTLAGFTALVAAGLLGNGIVLLSIGIVGQYMARVYDESRNRPLYILDAALDWRHE